MVSSLATGAFIDGGVSHCVWKRYQYNVRSTVRCDLSSERVHCVESDAVRYADS
jgi:hypothetical protein